MDDRRIFLPEDHELMIHAYLCQYMYHPHIVRPEIAGDSRGK